MSEHGTPTSPRSSMSIPAFSKVRKESRHANVRPSWAIDEDDEEEGRLRVLKGDIINSPEGFSEKDAFLPPSPNQARSTNKETRHWIPSHSRHVIITPEMLNDQLDLESPYNPNPFNDPKLAKVTTDTNFVIRKDNRHDTNGTHRTAMKRKTLWAKVRLHILGRGYVPFTLRLISWIFAIIALFLAAFITRFSVRGGESTRPSTVMAFAVNAIAIFYLPWVARDEYFGKAIGIRSARAKLRLILLDLLFIILNAADLALAFNVLYDNAAGCLTDSITDDSLLSMRVCRLQQAMAGVLFVTLMGFVINFTVSLYRLVERITADQ